MSQEIIENTTKMNKLIMYRMSWGVAAFGSQCLVNIEPGATNQKFPHGLHGRVTSLATEGFSMSILPPCCNGLVWSRKASVASQAVEKDGSHTP